MRSNLKKYIEFINENIMLMPTLNNIESIFQSMRDDSYQFINESVSEKILTEEEILHYFQPMIDDGVEVYLKYYVFKNSISREVIKIYPLDSKISKQIFEAYELSIIFKTGIYDSKEFEEELSHCISNMKIDYKDLQYKFDLHDVYGNETIINVIIYKK